MNAPWSCYREGQGKGLRGARDEIVPFPGKHGREWPLDLERGGTGREPQHIAVPQKGEQRLDLVIAVGAPCTHVQGEVDLGRCGFDDHGAARVLGGSPSAILRASRTPSSASATIAAARHA